MLNTTITIDDSQVKAKLNQLAELGQNMSEVLHRIGSEIVERTKHRFDTSTAPDGSPWAPNRPATKRAKGGKAPLYDSGLLREQIKASVNGNTLTVSTSPQTPYARIQHYGGTIDRDGGTITVSHRTTAKGDLLRTALFGGKGLIFSKSSHKRKVERQSPISHLSHSTLFKLGLTQNA